MRTPRVLARRFTIVAVRSDESVLTWSIGVTNRTCSGGRFFAHAELSTGNRRKRLVACSELRGVASGIFKDRPLCAAPDVDIDHFRACQTICDKTDPLRVLKRDRDCVNRPVIPNRWRAGSGGVRGRRDCVVLCHCWCPLCRACDTEQRKAERASPLVSMMRAVVRLAVAVNTAVCSVPSATIGLAMIWFPRPKYTRIVPAGTPLATVAVYLSVYSTPFVSATASVLIA